MSKYVWVGLLLLLPVAAAGSAKPQVGKSPWGPQDEIGRLNLMTQQSQAAVMTRVAGGRVYDLSVEYFVGMPSWYVLGDPRYQFWMTHTPHGAGIDDPLRVGAEQYNHVSYTGSAISMYTHMGTHIDALNHFGLNGRIWNGFSAAEHLGDRGWKKSGAETIPPIVARGVLIDVATAKRVEMLPPGYRINRADIEAALRMQRSHLQEGDVVLIRTGRMQRYENDAAFMTNAPGLGMDAARYLIEIGGAMAIGADNLSLEAFPSDVAGNYVPVHTYLLAQQGATIMELVYLEDLAKDRVYEFAFVAGSLKLRGADAAPVRPVAFPLRIDATRRK